MAITASFVSRAIKGLEKGNVWIAFNDTFTDIKIIQKDPYLLRIVKSLLRCCLWNCYAHINAQDILQHLKTRDWMAIDPAAMDRFYALFEQRIHYKHYVTSFNPSLRQEQISFHKEVLREESYSPPSASEEDSPALPPTAIPIQQRPSATVIDENGNTQLHRAILDRQQVNVHPKDVLVRTEQEIVRLLKSGVDPTIQNQKGDTILHLIADLPYWSPTHDRLVQTLLSHGAKANVPNKRGITAFHCIIGEKPSTLIVEALIKEGLADVNAPDHEGNTALHKIAYSDRSLRSWFDQESARVLLQNGAKVDRSNHAGNTPLHVAILSRGDVNKAIPFFCEEGRADVNAQNNDGDTPLHLLAGFNEYDIWNHKTLVAFLLKQGADKTLVNKKGQLPVHKASERSGSEVIDLLRV